jgi:23S rRNA U2552 (ribose-2'-O)-methylase RlmE/FtsJ
MQKAFLKTGKEVVYVLATPGFWSPVASCRLRQINILGYDFSPSKPTGLCRQERWTFERNEVKQRQYVAELGRDQPNVFMYDQMRALCDEQFCYQAGPEGVLFWTLQHVNEKGSTRVLNDFLAWARTNLRFFAG